MTTMGLDLNLERAAVKATRIRPLRVLFWALAAIPMLICFVLRMVWLLPAFLISSGAEGWNAADKLVKQWQVQARESASRGG